MNQLFNINNMVIAITGATGVLAGELAKYLLEQGAKVAILSRNNDKVQAAVIEAQKVSPNVLGYACDATSKKDMQKAHDAIIQQFGHVDALINGAGGNMSGATIGPNQELFSLNIDDYRSVMQLNLEGTVIPSLVFGESFAKTGKGNIINFSSMTANQAVTRVLGYSNAKAAVDNLTKWMATEMAQRHGDGIRVNAIAPGFFISNQNIRLLTNEDGSYTERGQSVITNTPMGRFGEAPEIFGAAHYLLSNASSFVTGTVLAVDGGFSVYSGV